MNYRKNWLKRTHTLVGTCLIALLSGCGLDAFEDVRETAAEIRGGNRTPSGVLDAVVKVGPIGHSNCSGTLITHEAILTAAHCFCGRGVCPSSNADCAPRATVTFMNVRPVESSVRQDLTIDADVVVHPEFCGGWMSNDYVNLKLDRPANKVVQVSPLFVAE